MKTFELVKELLLTQAAGAHDALNTSVDLAIDIHCECNQIDSNKFKEELKRRKDMLPKWQTYEEQVKYCELYEIVVEGMRNYAYPREYK